MSDVKDCNSRGLFEIVAINIETSEIVYEDKVISEGEKEALFDSNLKEVLNSKKLTRDDVCVLTRCFGVVPEKVRPKRFKVIGKIGKTMLASEEK